MEISRARRNAAVTSDKKTVPSKKDFSQNFSFARQQKSEQQLKEMMDDIKKKGNRLSITKCFADVKAYKNLIREYLDSVLKHMYEVKKDISFWQTQYFITVETVDLKLEELTQMLLSGEKENLDIANTIDEIAGLIVDVYK
ncbi:YaaR family protein [Clostridium tagluense]|uniref:YaaR family protein n=1 Tax=Clostridium TaxID=1485 RepID=UPI0013E96393|nr:MULTISPECIES: YaaR family protein [Clostridium]MBU3130076.1 YaaR family protein [Clostridium tagluense]MBW9156734.1 YaaR family protein [Clostridium tagluense]MBZ9625101.1 YaaR family protein [Clostridium sp. FP2]MCB2296868.1 YaaR family protein [Clostridium tagluense]MCB2313735.1 YaaR family protein [Clostridium tagluense]